MLLPFYCFITRMNIEIDKNVLAHEEINLARVRGYLHA